MKNSLFAVLKFAYVCVVIAMLALVFSPPGYNLAANLSFKYSNGGFLAAFGYWNNNWSFVWHPRLYVIIAGGALVGHFISGDHDGEPSRKQFMLVSVGFLVVTVLVMVGRYYAWQSV